MSAFAFVKLLLAWSISLKVNLDFEIGPLGFFIHWYTCCIQKKDIEYQIPLLYYQICIQSPQATILRVSHCYSRPVPLSFNKYLVMHIGSYVDSNPHSEQLEAII